MKDVAIEMHVRGRKGIDKHIPGLELNAVPEVVSPNVLLRLVTTGGVSSTIPFRLGHRSITPIV